MKFKKLREESFNNNLLLNAKTYWEINDEDLLKDSLRYRSINKRDYIYSINKQGFTVQMDKETLVNCIVLREAIHLGQSVEKFKITLYNNDQQVGEINGTTIGRKRILSFPARSITSFRVSLTDRNGNDNISGVAAYLIEEKLIEK